LAADLVGRKVRDRSKHKSEHLLDVRSEGGDHPISIVFSIGGRPVEAGWSQPEPPRAAPAGVAFEQNQLRPSGCNSPLIAS